MSMQGSQSFVSYEGVNQSYLRQRQLKGSAGFGVLCSLGVGIVISGDFTGWNSGLLAGGFWGLTIATFLVGVMYRHLRKGQHWRFSDRFKL